MEQEARDTIHSSSVTSSPVQEGTELKEETQESDSVADDNDSPEGRSVYPETATLSNPTDVTRLQSDPSESVAGVTFLNSVQELMSHELVFVAL